MKNLLKKWLTGEATWEDEKQLYQQAQKDDFLAEAWEGYQAFPETDHATTLERLKKRHSISKKASNKRISWRRIAAAAALIGAIGLFYWTTNEFNTTAPSIEIAERQALPAPTYDETEKTTEVITAKEELEEEAMPPPNKPAAKTKRPTAEESLIANAAESTVPASPSTKARKKVARPIESSNSPLAKTAPSEVIAETIHRPLESNNPSTEDKPSEVMAETETVSEMPLQPSRSKARTTTDLPIQEKAMSFAVDAALPSPENGFEAYANYIKKNLQYPKSAQEKSIETVVKLEFFIDTVGMPTKIKVLNPDDYGFDKEAIRLLKNGTKWFPVNAHAAYAISFKLVE